MAVDDGESDSDPLIQPRLIRFLKERPKLINMGMREEVLEELENVVSDRRKPDKVAKKAARESIDRATKSTQPVIENRAKARMDKLNQSIFKKL